MISVRTSLPTAPAKQHAPYPEELAQQASRRMDATHGLAAILRDARDGALLRMRLVIRRLTIRSLSQEALA
jgi:hypothetical protein